MIRIEIHTDNAAFQENPNELGDILQKIGKAVNYGLLCVGETPVFDTNGNQVGFVKYE
jgi:hypothetical protein